MPVNFCLFELKTDWSLLGNGAVATKNTSFSQMRTQRDRKQVRQSAVQASLNLRRGVTEGGRHVTETPSSVVIDRI